MSPGSVQPTMPPQEHLESILAKNRPYLLRQAQRLCRGNGGAEDLVQDASLRFLTTFQTAPLLDEARCAGWLATALYNSFITYLRKAKVQDRAQQDPSLGESMVSPPESDPPSIWELVTVEELRTAVLTLSRKQREVFEAQAAGKSYEDIAVSLGIPRTTVAKRLHDARLRLRVKLLAMIARRRC